MNLSKTGTQFRVRIEFRATEHTVALASWALVRLRAHPVSVTSSGSTVPIAIGSIVLSGAPSEIRGAIVAEVAIQMTGLMTRRRKPMECKGDETMNS